MVRSMQFQPNARSYPDPIRVVAISASIAINVAMLALLMRPSEFTLPITHEDAPPITIIVPEKPPEPIIRTVVKTHPTPTVHKAIPQVTHPKPPPVIATNHSPMGTEVIPQPPIDHPVVDTRVGSQLPVEASLMPIASPAPMYPRDALRDGITGTVELELLVGIDGRVLEVRMIRGSGNRELDAAARDQVLRNWRFQPAMRDGVAVQALGRVPIVFTLDGR